MDTTVEKAIAKALASYEGKPLTPEMMEKIKSSTVEALTKVIAKDDTPVKLPDFGEPFDMSHGDLRNRFGETLEKRDGARAALCLNTFHGCEDPVATIEAIKELKKQTNTTPGTSFYIRIQRILDGVDLEWIQPDERKEDGEKEGR